MKDSLESLYFLPLIDKKESYFNSITSMRAIYTFIKYIEDNNLFSETTMSCDDLLSLGYNAGNINSFLNIKNNVLIDEFKELCKFKITKSIKDIIDIIMNQKEKRNHDSIEDRNKYECFNVTNFSIVKNDTFDRLDSFYKESNLDLIEFELLNMKKKSDTPLKFDSVGYIKYFLLVLQSCIDFNSFLSIVKCLCLSIFIYEDFYYEDKTISLINDHRRIEYSKLTASHSSYSRVEQLFTQIINLGYIKPLTMISCMDNLSLLFVMVNERWNNFDRKRDQVNEKDHNFIYSLIYMEEYLDYNLNQVNINTPVVEEVASSLNY